MGVVQLIQRLRDEFTAMPGLQLTEAQVQRLCTSDAATASSALRALASAGFLTVMDGAYARTDIFRGRAQPRPTSWSTAVPQAAWRRILCIVDLENDRRDSLTAKSMAALRYATTLAVTSRTRIIALHVVPRTQQQTTLLTDITQLLRRSVSGEALRELIDVRVTAGSPNEEILRVARDIEAGLIVLAADGPDRASPSALREVLRQAPCPVLIVHPSGRAAVA